MTIHPDTEEFAKALAAARKAVGMSAAEDQLIPDPKLQRERYHCSPMSFVRWDSKPALGFPRAVKIGNRNHRWLSMLLEWERRCAVADANMPLDTVGTGRSVWGSANRQRPRSDRSP